MSRIWWWAGPVLAAAVGFPAGAIPAAVVFLSLGGLDPAHNLGISDELVNYVIVVAGASAAAVGASLAARCGPAQSALVVAIVLGVASACSAIVFLGSYVTTGPGAVLLWVAVLITVAAAGVSARLVRRRVALRAV